MLYELAALSHAFEGQSLMGVMYKIVEGALPELPEMYSKELGRVFHKYVLFYSLQWLLFLISISESQFSRSTNQSINQTIK